MSANIKSLQTQVNKLRLDRDAKKLEIARFQRELEATNKSIRDIEDRIKRAEGSGDIIITEHAILRYCERVMMIDMNKVREQIVTPEIEQMVASLGGNGRYPNKGFHLVMQENKVVTIVTK